MAAPNRVFVTRGSRSVLVAWHSFRSGSRSARRPAYELRLRAYRARRAEVPRGPTGRLPCRSSNSSASSADPAGAPTLRSTLPR